MTPRKAIALLFAVLLVVGVFWSVFGARKAYAQTGQSTRPVSIPKSYGAFKGTTGPAMIFEDSSGTIRVVEVSDHDAQVVMTIVRN
jgi:hypothetical protein